MKKIRIGISFWLMLAFCLATKQFLIVVNYLSALLIHEISHLIVASRRGYNLKMLRIDMFGLSVELQEKINDSDTFAINIAGPLINLVIVVMCMALYWLVPASYTYLSTFCVCNFVLAIFNLIPVYPLDGGKILKSMIKNQKNYEKFDFFLRFVIFFGMLVIFFALKCQNIMLLILSIFFLPKKTKKQPNFSLFKFAKHKNIEKVVLLKVDGNNSLFSLIKQLKQSHYTIFYYKTDKNIYIDEDSLVDLALKNNLESKLKDVV